jgi:hypothetical protein
MLYTNRWLAYFDLLGFKNLVRKNYIEDVLSIYEEDALDSLRKSAEPHKINGISFFWFSDTFIIFTKGDSEKEFAYIEQVSRLFFQRLILNHIPVRGALTVGSFYADQDKKVFLGEALIDAYEYGEKQNWLGFLLTPHVYHHLKNSSIPLKRRLCYRPADITSADIPKVVSHPNSKNVYAFAFNNIQINNRNPYLDAVVSMKAEAGKKDKVKYSNTEEFIKKYGTLTVVSKDL